jgi:serine O-acetyltransferase
MRICEDLSSFGKYNKLTYNSEIKKLVYLLTFYPEFRNVFYKRTGHISYLFSFLRPRVKSLHICTHSDLIGGGLFIEHGFATIISAKEIGNNCHINQQVTLGHTEKGNPVIGNNVRICAGVVIVGDIKIGDNSVIGAGVTVVKNVPDNSVVINSPAYYYNKSDKSKKHEL